MQAYTGKVKVWKGHDKVSNEWSEMASRRSTNDGSKAPITQNAKVNDAPSCAKCGEVFNPPWIQRHHRCPGSAEPSKIVDKPVPAARTRKAVEVPEESQRARASTISRMETNEAADEDLPRCNTCGKTFLRSQLRERYEHKCEPPEVTQPPDRRRIQKRASSVSSDVLATYNIEERSKSETDSTCLTCGCGKTFVGS